MATPVIILLFLLGLVLIIKGGDLFVDAAVWIAEASGIPKFLIGATIVSLATTIPELLVSLLAAAEGSVGMACGNAIGSVTANLGLIMGISIVCIPAVIQRRDIALKGALMVAAAALLWAFCAGGSLPIGGSVVLLAVFLFYVAYNVLDARRSRQAGGEEERESVSRRDVGVNIVKFIAGAAGIAVGANLLVEYGSALARLLGVSEAIIGVTLVAIGTSLPELVTTITAISKKQASLSIGNIVGANIIDLTLILPLCAVISGKALPVLDQTRLLDLPVCIFFCAVAVVPALIEKRFRRVTGVAMLAAYAAYVVVLCVRFAV